MSKGHRAPGLLSLGTLYNVGFWVFYSSPEPLDHLGQFKGKHIALGPKGSGIRVAGEKVFAAAGVTDANADLSSIGGDDAFDALKTGKVDAVWTTSPPGAPIIQSVLHAPNVRLFDFKNADA